MGQTITERLDTLTREGRKILRDRDLNALKMFKQLEQDWEQRVLDGKASKDVEDVKAVVTKGKNKFLIDGSRQSLSVHYAKI